MSSILKHDMNTLLLDRGPGLPLSIRHPHRHFPVRARFRKRLRLSRGARCERVTFTD